MELSSTSRLIGVLGVSLLLAVGAEILISSRFQSKQRIAQTIVLLQSAKNRGASEVERLRATLPVVAPGSRLYVEDPKSGEFTGRSTGDVLPHSASSWARSCVASHQASCVWHGMVAAAIPSVAGETAAVVSIGRTGSVRDSIWLCLIPSFFWISSVLAVSTWTHRRFEQRLGRALEGAQFADTPRPLLPNVTTGVRPVWIDGFAERLRTQVRGVLVAATELENREREHLEWIAYLSHDLASPLSRMLRRVETIQYDSEMASVEKESTLKELHREIEEVAEIVGSLSQFATLESNAERSFSEVSIPQLLEHTVGDFEYEASAKDIHLRLAAAADLGTAQIERSLIKRALENLISNAIRHTPEGGEINVSGYREDGQLRIMIEDTGTGLPVQVLERIFNFGFRGGQTRLSNVGSLGLGLAMVKRVAEIHSGTVAASNVEPHGARFVLSLTV